MKDYDENFELLIGWIILATWLLLLLGRVKMRKATTTTGHTPTKKGTSIGKRPKSMATMNKHKKRSFKKYRGQGR